MKTVLDRDDAPPINDLLEGTCIDDIVFSEIKVRTHTPLTFACTLRFTLVGSFKHEGYLRVAELLLARGARAGDHEWTTGRTPLHFAATAADAHLAELLLDHGADADASCKVDEIDTDEAKGFDEFTPLHALLALHLPGKGMGAQDDERDPAAVAETAELLLRRGACVDKLESGNESTPLFKCTFNNNCAAARVLLRHG